MRIAIVSDIHANQVALETVLAVLGSFDQLWNLGDTIGYGPRPNECIQLVQPLSNVLIAGNHDLACIGKVDLSDFNSDARIANVWNGQQLNPEYRAMLEALPPQMDIDAQFCVAHGSPREPVWEYLLSRTQAEANFALFEQQVCMIGHSHVPLVFAKQPEARCGDPLLAHEGMTVELQPDWRYFINPGSVGQPRDRDPRAAYAVLDTGAGSVSFHRVEYDVSSTQRQMRDAGLPYLLIRRLEHGV